MSPMNLADARFSMPGPVTVSANGPAGVVGASAACPAADRSVGDAVRCTGAVPFLFLRTPAALAALPLGEGTGSTTSGPSALRSNWRRTSTYAPTPAAANPTPTPISQSLLLTLLRGAVPLP